ncbi:hypothetical protein BKA83DRAFT_4129532 [Pisolithus microcarpus]|nr:hypothetical protein BKA83DRAFT_4129532 [Pisolithus microcarpus]
MQIVLLGGKSMTKMDGGEGMGINMWMEKGRGGHTLQEGPGGWLLLLEELDGSSGETGEGQGVKGTYPAGFEVVAFLGEVLQAPDLSGGERAWGAAGGGGKEMQLSVHVYVHENFKFPWVM